MKTILVGLDNSPHATYIANQAALLATSTGANLIFIRAINLPLDLGADIYYQTPDKLLAELQENAKNELLQLANSLSFSKPIDIRVQVGIPWQVICDLATTLKVDTVVIGSHGYRLFERLLGTTAARVVNHAPCSVWVIRPVE